MVATTAIREAAEAAIKIGELDAARPLWSQLCELEPLDADNWIILSAIDEKLGFLPAALGHLNYARYLAADDPDIWLQSAGIRWRMQDFDAAFADIANALALDFTDPVVRSRFASWLMECNRFDDALVHYRYLLNSQNGLEKVEGVRALACAFCASSVADFERFLPVPTPGTNDALVRAVTETIANLVHPRDFLRSRSLDSAASAESASLLKQIGDDLETRYSKFDWQTFFDRRAHVFDYVQSEEEREAMRALSQRIHQDVKASGAYFPHVLDLGCGTGRIGDELVSNEAQVILTGIDRSQESIDVANRKNHYDTLIYADVERRFPVERVASADFIVIADLLEYCSDPTRIIGMTAAAMSRGASLYVTWEPTQRSGSIEAGFDSFREEKDWELEELNVPGRKAVILTRLPARASFATNGANDRGAVRESLGNRLIHAAQLLGNGHYQQCFEKSKEVVEHFPGSSLALFHVGVHAQDQRNFDIALNYFHRALSIHKGFSDAWFHIGAVYQQLGWNPRSAIRSYHSCLKYAPGHIVALKNLAQLYFRLNDTGSAWQALQHLLSQHPLDVQQLEEIGTFIAKQPDRTLPERLQAYLNSVDWIKAQLGQALNRRYAQRAESLVKQLAEAGVDERELLYYRAQIAEKSGDIALAKSRCLKLVREDRRNPNYWQFLASASAAQGKLKTAHRLWRIAAATAEPVNPMLQNRLFFSNYWQHVSDTTIAEMHKDWGRKLASALNVDVNAKPFSRREHKRLRIGYVGGDFRMHSVSIFFYNILKYRDRDQFEVYCYSMNPNDDNMTIKLRLFSDHWREIQKLDDKAVAELIQRDEIDILVDLAGHTASNRLPLFCRRPAPVQCTYLGYANTTGLAELDYRITDPKADPVGLTEQLHSEELLRLPHGFLTYSRHMDSTPITIGAEKHPTRHYTFACCNNVYKVNDEVIAVWSQILRQLPRAKLLIKASNLSNREIIATYQKKFHRRGISQDQVHLMNTLDINEHQNLYNHVDIALDPFPYNGTTTTCDALWMGVPVLALAGTRHSGRVGVSILSQVGLTDWIARDTQDYIDKAVRFAQDAPYLQELKLTMRQRMRNSSLMKSGVIARDLEDAYRHIWHEYQASQHHHGTPAKIEARLGM